MGPKQFAGVLSLVRRAKAARKGEKFDEKLDKQLVELVKSATEKESVALSASSMLTDDGIIDPRNRNVLGFCLSVADNNEVKGAESYGFSVMTIRKVLIANGEIAVRIIRTLKNLGLYSVAVYSDADRTSPFVEKADEAVLLPNSYLDQETIILKAKALNVDAIHPGYGFCQKMQNSQKKKEAGIKWIGPNSETIVLMGDKINSKNFVKEGVIPSKNLPSC